MVEFSFLAYEFLWYGIFLITLRHALLRWGIRNTAVFFAPAIAWGFLLEYATQEIFHRYAYGTGFLVYLLNVPLNISLAWASLLYFGYYSSKEKLKLKTPWKVSLASALPLISLDLIVFEPLAKAFGYWKWTPESLWFGSPIGNAYGWLWVVFLYLTAFQWIETQKWDWKKKLLANLVAIVFNVMALTILLKIWVAFFGYT